MRHEITASKKSRGALLFWTWFNTVASRQEQSDQIILSLSRAVQIQRQRLDVLERKVAGLSGIVRRDEPLTQFHCISCGHEFDIPRGEAESLELIEVCPKCYGWAFAGSAGKVYTTRQVAAELGVSTKWVRVHGHKQGLGRG